MDGRAVGIKSIGNGPYHLDSSAGVSVAPYNRRTGMSPVSIYYYK